MRNIFYFCIGVALCLLTACSSQKRGDDSDIQVLMKDSVDANGLQRMQVSDIKTTFTYRGKDYQSKVVRRPDDHLPIVTNEGGEKFVDNSISLRLTSGGKTIVDKVFTKGDFASLVDAKYMKQFILEGLVYDKTTPKGIVYAASICYPQTDLYIPLSLTITPDGKITMMKEELLEDLHPTDSMN